MADQTYRLAYRVVVLREGTRKENIPPGWVACDAVLVSPLVYSADGKGFGIAVNSIDGRTKLALSFGEMFNVWATLAHELALHKEATPGKVDLCIDVCNILSSPTMAEALGERFNLKIPESCDEEVH